ncbi:glutamine--fructose-6-phosphate transaminase (isomerizing) [Emergencia sp. 1XD21-10]|uniref:glutamine--fructose-6-phosphate transaminase (isomerizing) n=1 Tax=Emergencia sp. 1XD21-10 TaxID=2304569 RepID=UPI00137958D1|nr:glutamine--fructose-6-phosphate transaminase (isomerizing) [Emergencia sp. 1XD21-10]NCE99617.1 glutamine--fructose-6-phosphate transaminase (isomerizing) [Emergencia sp. 1XD21-10]
MCGIVGYVGADNARDIIIDGLKKLEYRGYDSAGIALHSGGELIVRKKEGKIANLEKDIAGENLYGTTGIGHTRWATHGVPSDANAHPHINGDSSIAIVHNGIVENYVELKEWLTKEHGITFRTETDSEVIAHLLGVLKKTTLEDAVFEAVKMMRGAYAIVAMSKDEPGKIVAYRKDAPLIAGLGKGCNFIASDIPALLKYLNKIYLIENNEMVICTPEQIQILNQDRKPVKRDVLQVTWSLEDAEKDGYEHFMLKEIHEQPKAIRETLTRRLDENGRVKLDGISLTLEDLKKFNKIYIVACGTAYHAGLVGKYAIEKMARIPVEVDVASEFRYRDPFVDENTLFIAISQSGETLDTLAALREAKSKGARILSVVNVVGSSVARESDDVFYTWAGPEIAVASTKAYTTQMVCMYLIALYMGDLKGTITEEYYQAMLAELMAAPEKVERIIEKSAEIEKLAKVLYNRTQVFFIGRGMDSAVAYEGSLKLKEISYINSFAIAAGELKHGTIALMEPETIVIALATQDALFEKMFSNIVEVKARLAHVVSIAKEGKEQIEKQSNEVIYIPPCADEVSPLLSVIPLQLFAYYVAREKGEDIDKPRNLAKSVTVE